MRVHRLILSFSAFGIFAVSGHAATLYAAIAGSSNFYGTLDTTTGVFTQITTQTPALFGMGFTGNGMMYGTDDSATAGVYSIVPTTGALTLLGTIAGTTEGSTVGSDGMIYGLSNGLNASFFKINPVTLAVTIINPNVGFQSDGLGVFSGGLFYTSLLSGTGNDILEAINPVTGVVTAVGTGMGHQIIAGVNVNGLVYAASTDGNLYTINTALGTSAFDVAISGPPASFVDALAFFSTPEPSTGMLAGFGLALAGAVSALRFRRRAS